MALVKLKCWSVQCLQVCSVRPLSLEDYLYQLQDEPGSTQVFIGELHMKGDFVKFNNNGGSVNKAEHRAHCAFLAQQDAEPHAPSCKIQDAKF